MGKIGTFIESDGFGNTLHYIWKSLKSQFTHTSHTYCLFADRGDTVLSRRGGVLCRVSDNYKGGAIRDCTFRKIETMPLAQVAG